MQRIAYKTRAGDTAGAARLRERLAAVEQQLRAEVAASHNTANPPAPPDAASHLYGSPAGGPGRARFRTGRG